MNKKLNPYNSRTNQHKCYKIDKKKLDKLCKQVRNAYYSDIDKLTIDFTGIREKTEIRKYKTDISMTKEEMQKCVIDSFKEEFGNIFTDEEIILSLELVKETDLYEYSIWDLKILLEKHKNEDERKDYVGL